MIKKNFRLSADQIAPIAPGFGGCLATDRIVVDGARVGYMYREQTTRDLDSGWRFFSGDEDADYMSVSDHHGVYDVNTIANYDIDIVPFLNAGYGSEFERDDDGQFQSVRPGNEP